MIILIGLMLAPVAVQNADGTNAPELKVRLGTAGCLGLAFLTFGVGVAVKIYGRRLGMRFVSTLPVLIALAAAYLASLVRGLVDLDRITAAPWVGLPRFALPEFQATVVFVALPVALVTIMEHLGDVLAIGNVVGKDFTREPGLHRTLLGDGVATTAAAFIGGPANTTYSENTGTVALTGNHDPAVMRFAAVFAVLLSFVPKFSAVIATIPTPVVGGISILLFGMIASIGIKTLIDHRVDLSRPKVMMTVSAMLVLGLGGAEFEWGSFRLSGLGFAAVVGILLNAIIRDGARKGTEG